MIVASEARDVFVSKYKLQCLLRKTQEIDLPNKMIAFLLSQAQQDILNRVKALSTYKDVSLTAVTAFTTYTLETNFGGLKGKPTIEGSELEVVSMEELPTNGTLDTGDPSQAKCAVYHDGTAWKMYLYPLSNSTKTLRYWYYINTGFYSPSGVSAQNWGTFDGKTFTGNLKIPDEYLTALIYYMLGEVFNDFKILYLEEIKRMKGNSAATVKDSLDYNMGNIEYEQ